MSKEITNKLYCLGYRRTKVKEFFKQKKCKRKYILLTSKKEVATITGIPINKNGKPIL